MCAQESLTDDPLNAFCRHNHVALRGSGNGSLRGLTFAVKDIFDVAGHRTGFGHPDWLATHLPAQRTASVIARLLAVGARMIGRTHCDELCYGLTGGESSATACSGLSASSTTRSAGLPTCKPYSSTFMSFADRVVIMLKHSLVSRAEPT